MATKINTTSTSTITFSDILGLIKPETLSTGNVVFLFMDKIYGTKVEAERAAIAYYNRLIAGDKAKAAGTLASSAAVGTVKLGVRTVGVGVAIAGALVEEGGGFLRRLGSAVKDAVKTF